MNAAKKIGRVVGDYESDSDRVVLRQFERDPAQFDRTLPIRHPQQKEIAWLTYTEPLNRRNKRKAVAKAIGKSVQAADLIIRLLKDDPYYGPKMKTETTTTKGGKK